jgi:membrane protease YdiL (CAAX protease family)
MEPGLSSRDRLAPAAGGRLAVWAPPTGMLARQQGARNPEAFSARHGCATLRFAMERERHDSGPPLPPGPGGAMPILLSFGLVAFLLVSFLTMGTLIEWLRPGGTNDPVNLLFVGLVAFPLTVLAGLQVDPAGFVSLRVGLGVGPTRAMTATFAILLGLAAVLPLSELDNVVQHYLPLGDEEQVALLKLVAFDGWAGHLAKVLALAVVTPIGEEILFRGVMQRWLRRSHGRLAAIVVSSLLFGLAHLSLRLFVPVFLLGLAFAWIADRAHSALPTIGAHAAYNAVPFLFPPQVADVPGWTPAPGTEAAHLPVAWVTGSSVACLVLLYLIWWSTLRRE